MSQSNSILTLKQGMQVGGDFVTLLSEATDACQLVGSLRRQRPHINDIDILCVPVLKKNLLGEPTDPEQLDNLLKHAIKKEWLAPGRFNGDRFKDYQIPKMPGIRLNLFITDMDSWGAQAVIRTGGAEFARKFVTPRRHGGLMPWEYCIHQGKLTECIRDEDSGEVKHWGKQYVLSERELMKKVCKQWVHPRDRSARTAHSIYSQLTG